jgi:hypothetical protein
LADAALKRYLSVIAGLAPAIHQGMDPRVKPAGDG